MSTLKLEQYVNFNSVEELNHHVSQHVSNNQLNDTQYKLLTILAQHSVKYIGASYLKVSTLMGLLSMSKSTIKRHLRALADMGIITKQRTFRPVSGGCGANIYVLNAYIDPSPVTPRPETENTSGSRLMTRLEQEETTSHKSISKFIGHQPSSINREYNLSYKDVCPSHIPLTLGEHMLKFFDSATVTRLYSSMKSALSVYEDRVDYDDERLTVYMQRGFNALVLAIKNHIHHEWKYTPVHNIFGYVYQATLSIAVKDEFGFD